MKIKKIIIMTGSSLGVIGGVAIPIINKTINIKQKSSVVIKDNIIENSNLQPDPTLSSYHYDGSDVNNRLYHIVLSAESTNDMWNAIKQYKTSFYYGGVYTFMFLTTSPAKWAYASRLMADLIGFDDNNSFMNYFKGINSHTLWNFDYYNFIKMIQQKITNHQSMKIEMKVDYKFLAHNLYGVTVK